VVKFSAFVVKVLTASKSSKWASIAGKWATKAMLAVKSVNLSVLGTPEMLTFWMHSHAPGWIPHDGLIIDILPADLMQYFISKSIYLRSAYIVLYTTRSLASGTHFLYLLTSVVDLDPAGSKIICIIGSRSVIELRVLIWIRIRDK
jgi:hypothetical protein